MKMHNCLLFTFCSITLGDTPFVQENLIINILLWTLSPSAHIYCGLYFEILQYIIVTFLTKLYRNKCYQKN
jgi:hypothetical protein